ncbi:MAG TPA: hypothetical protein VHJ99_01510 [Candidatus Dormibacteraeota bacterium]|nr:hypothetical protein [Candidatus Dormibacteraeota bacterium]
MHVASLLSCVFRLVGGHAGAGGCLSSLLCGRRCLLGCQLGGELSLLRCDLGGQLIGLDRVLSLLVGDRGRCRVDGQRREARGDLRLKMLPMTERPVVVGVEWANTDVIARIAPTAAAAVATPILNRLFLGKLASLCAD